MNASTKAILLAAAMSTVTSVASAQYRIGNDGRALDASNRIGSNGYNSGPTVGATGAVNGNEIVTGNVTGGREFRGNVGYTDPKAFRGVTADATSDRFIRSSSAAPYGGVDQNNANRTTAFYGNSRAAAPPPGFEQQGFSTGAYVPAPPPGRSNSDLRLGAVVATPQTILPQPGDLLLPGPVEPNLGNTMISASPLYGVRQWRENVDSERQFVDRFANDARPAAPDDLRLDRKTIDRYRAELNGTDNANDPAKPDGDALPSGTDLTKPQDIGNTAFNTNAIDNKAVTEEALKGGVATDQTLRQELATPAKQSELYAKLLKQFNDQGGVITDQEAHRRFELQRAALAGGDDEDGAQTTRKPSAADATAADGAAAEQSKQFPIDPNAKAAVPAEPIDVNNLAEGIRGKGLADLINKAQAHMKKGEFGAAIDRFDAAAKVAPNNALITLGRAHAELGASFYGRAEADLRKSFGQAPELLVGRYSLVEFIGEDRLAFVIKDLKSIATAETQQAGPTFLLAYISRNMGNNDRAADYLTETEKRLGGPDDLIGTMRKVWNLPIGNEMK